MNIKTLTAMFSIVFFSVLPSQAQGTFQNLDFEQADPVPIVGSPYYPYAVTVASALPGWNAFIGGVPANQVFFNDYSLGAASIDLFGPGWNSVEPGIIDGNYTVFLQAGVNPGAADNVSLSQSGTIPANEQSLQLSAWSWPSVNSAFSVSFNGVVLPLVVLSSDQTASGQAYDVYGANIAPYASQTGQLDITSIATGAPSWTELDDIMFSPSAVVPEPSILTLTAIGGLLFAARRWIARRRQ